MEYSMSDDMANADWFVAKVRASEAYAQNLYAAMCNREFVKNDVWPLLKDQRWSCSWRSSGGIVADLRNAGEDYLDYYCSGIRGGLNEQEIADMTDEDRNWYHWMLRHYVGESFVTEEIKQDLFRLGWLVIDDEPETW